MIGIIDFAGGAQPMSSNDDRAITSSITARETPAGPMPCLALPLAREDLCESVAKLHLKGPEQRAQIA